MFDIEFGVTPLDKIIELHTWSRAFPQVSQKLFPNDHPDGVWGYRLHFTQIMSQEKIDKDTTPPMASTSPFDSSQDTKALVGVRQKEFA